VPKKSLKNLRIDRSWTLFLDRDGIINRLIVGGYVTRWSEFDILPDFLEAAPLLSDIFGRIIVVTNQQCVHKKLVTKKELVSIHKKMVALVKKAGGKIDKVYFCPHASAGNCICRKPKTGMIKQAKKDFPKIDLSRSIMVGDMVGDIGLAKNAGMLGVFIGSKVPKGVKPDYTFRTIKSFLKSI